MAEESKHDFRKKVVQLADGRKLIYYDFNPGSIHSNCSIATDTTIPKLQKEK